MRLNWVRPTYKKGFSDIGRKSIDSDSVQHVWCYNKVAPFDSNTSHPREIGSI